MTTLFAVLAAIFALIAALAALKTVRLVEQVLSFQRDLEKSSRRFQESTRAAPDADVSYYDRRPRKDIYGDQ